MLRFTSVCKWRQRCVQLQCKLSVNCSPLNILTENICFNRFVLAGGDLSLKCDVSSARAHSRCLQNHLCMKAFSDGVQTDYKDQCACCAVGVALRPRPLRSAPSIGACKKKIYLFIPNLCTQSEVHKEKVCRGCARTKLWRTSQSPDLTTLNTFELERWAGISLSNALEPE